MRKLALAPIPLACALCGCTSIQEAHFQADVATFNNDVALIDSTIATVLHAQANNCTKLAAAQLFRQGKRGP